MRHGFALAAGALVCAAAGLAVPAAAGDFAEFRPIGFSKDGKVFAFEEFGVQDGSGFPYANRFYIDTESDAYLPGTPVRVRLDDETASIAQARAEAARAAAEIAETDDPGIFAAFAPATERGNDGYSLSYQSFAIEPFPGGAYTVVLNGKPLDAGGHCAGLGEEFRGFRLEMTEKNGAPVSIVLHEDSSIPASRNCPLSYRLGGALTHANPDGSTTHAVLVLVRSIGFEGPNGRWIAVTTRLD